MKWSGVAGGFIWLTFFLAGCAANRSGEEVRRVVFEEIKPPPPGPVQTESYRVRPGDVIGVKFVNNPELNENTPVRSDGKISLALVGEMTAAGLTIVELQRAISERFRAFISRTQYAELLKEGDDLQIRFMYNPELNQALNIRADGKISMPLVGEIQAAGARPSDLRQRLIEEYSKHLRNPDVTILIGGLATKKIFPDETLITVTITKPAEQAVFVGGEVLSPKAVRFDAQLTTLQAIMQAGGVKETGDLSQVVILRRGTFERGEWIQTNLSNPLNGKSLQNDIPLRDGDVVVVPLSGIAKVNLWVKQYIRDVLPLQSTFSVTSQIYDAGPASR